MGREHWHWKPNLLKEANAGNRRAQKILFEGQQPGEYFDGLTHLFDVIKIMNQEIQNGATHIGIFGSRLRKTNHPLGIFRKRRTHRPLDSDVDLLIIRDEAKDLGEVIRTGIADGINVVRYSLDTWQYNNLHTHDDTAVREIMQSVKWLWIKKDHFGVGRVWEWHKTTF